MTAIGEFKADGLASIDQADQPMSEMQPNAAERATKDALQVGPVNAVVGAPKRF
jgi:hypothetical protein